MEWAPAVGQFQAADLTGLRGLFLLEAGGAQVAEFVENDEVAADELVCGAALASGAELGFEVVDQVDDVVAPAAGTLSDAGPRDGDGEMGLAGAADQHDVALTVMRNAG